MFAYIIKRLLMMIPVLVGITMISFLVINLAPGDPTDLQMELNPKMTPEIVEKLKKHYELDKPIHIRYVKWLKNIATLDFGKSFAPDGRKVIDKIGERLPVTLTINLLSITLILLISIPLGVFISVKKGSVSERMLSFLSLIFYSIPSFWFALILITIFGVELGLLPISGLKSLNYSNLGFMGKIFDFIKHLVLPVIVASIGGIAGFSRYMASNFDDVIRQEYIMLARIKGLPEHIVLRRHALKNALLPVITILGLSVPGLIGGSVIVESIFSIPGMGELFYKSVLSRDYPVIMGMLVISSFLTLLGNLIADIGYALADPRIRFK